MSTTIANLKDFLSWLTGLDGGAFILVMWVVSWGLSGVSWWEALDAKLKQIIIIGAAVVLGILGVLMQNAPAFVAAVDPFFKPVMSIVLLWLASQTVRKVETLVYNTSAKAKLNLPPPVVQPVDVIIPDAKG
jgi:hypothetical protein